MRISDWSSDVCSSDLFDLGAFLVHQHRAVGHLVNLALTPFGIDNRQFAVAGKAEDAATLVGDGRHVAIFDPAVRNRLQMRSFVALRRAAPVEGTPGQLGSRVTHPLPSDAAHALAEL